GRPHKRHASQDVAPVSGEPDDRIRGRNPELASDAVRRARRRGLDVDAFDSRPRGVDCGEPGRLPAVSDPDAATTPGEAGRVRAVAADGPQTPTARIEAGDGPDVVARGPER